MLSLVDADLVLRLDHGGDKGKLILLLMVGALARGLDRLHRVVERWSDLGEGVDLTECLMAEFTGTWVVLHDDQPLQHLKPKVSDLAAELVDPAVHAFGLRLRRQNELLLEIILRISGDLRVSLMPGARQDRLFEFSVPLVAVRPELVEPLLPLAEEAKLHPCLVGVLRDDDREAVRSHCEDLLLGRALQDGGFVHRMARHNKVHQRSAHLRPENEPARSLNGPPLLSLNEDPIGERQQLCDLEADRVVVRQDLVRLADRDLVPLPAGCRDRDRGAIFFKCRLGVEARPILQEARHHPARDSFLNDLGEATEDLP